MCEDLHHFENHLAGWTFLLDSTIEVDQSSQAKLQAIWDLSIKVWVILVLITPAQHLSAQEFGGCKSAMLSLINRSSHLQDIHEDSSTSTANDIPKSYSTNERKKKRSHFFEIWHSTEQCDCFWISKSKTNLPKFLRLGYRLVLVKVHKGW
jgi:hypothetical protein